MDDFGNFAKFSQFVSDDRGFTQEVFINESFVSSISHVPAPPPGAPDESVSDECFIRMNGGSTYHCNCTPAEAACRFADIHHRNSNRALSARS